MSGYLFEKRSISDCLGYGSELVGSGLAGGAAAAFAPGAGRPAAGQAAAPASAELRRGSVCGTAGLQQLAALPETVACRPVSGNPAQLAVTHTVPDAAAPYTA